MNISQRLRTCAKHTGLDAVIELLNDAADEIDALQARAQVHPAQATPVCEAQNAESDQQAPLSLTGTTQPAEAKTDEPVAWLYIEDGEVMFGHPNGYRPPDARPLVFGDTHPAPRVPDDVVRDAQRWRTFLATRPSNTHEVIIAAIDAASPAQKGEA